MHTWCSESMPFTVTLTTAACVYTITLQAAVKRFGVATGWFNYRTAKPNSANFKLHRQSDVTKAASGEMWRGGQTGERWDVRVIWQRSALYMWTSRQSKQKACSTREVRCSGGGWRQRAGAVMSLRLLSHAVQMWITPPLCAPLFYCFDFFFFQSRVQLRTTWLLVSFIKTE